MVSNGLTYHCSKCQAHFTIVCFGPGNTVGSPSFCPRCGTQFGLDSHRVGDFDPWDVFAKANDMSVTLARQLFVMWDPNTTPTFSQFVKELIEEE